MVYRQIAEQNPRGSLGREALYKAAWLAYNAGQHREALALFGGFVERFPRDHAAPEALWYLGWNAFHVRDLPVAQATFKRLREDFFQVTSCSLPFSLLRGRSVAGTSMAVESTRVSRLPSCKTFLRYWPV